MARGIYRTHSVPQRRHKNYTNLGVPPIPYIVGNILQNPDTINSNISIPLVLTGTVLQNPDIIDALLQEPNVLTGIISQNADSISSSITVVEPMANIVYKAKVWEVGVLSGSGPFTLPSVAKTGYRTVSGSGITTNGEFFLDITDNTANVWDISLWSYASGVITRVQFIDSSTGSPISFTGNSCDIKLISPPATVASNGTASSGLPVVLGLNGLLDSSVIAITGGLTYGDMQPSVNYYVWPTINPSAASGGATKASNTTVRNTVPWRFSQKPISFGVVCNVASSGGNCQIRLYTPTANYTAGVLLYDSGIMSTATTGVLMGTVISGGITLPDVFIYDFAVDTAGNSAAWVHGNVNQIGGPLDMSGGSSGTYPGITYAVYYTGIQSPASNPCNYDSTVSAYYAYLSPSLMAQF
jgi:hypothetical protein